MCAVTWDVCREGERKSPFWPLPTLAQTCAHNTQPRVHPLAACAFKSDLLPSAISQTHLDICAHSDTSQLIHKHSTREGGADLEHVCEYYSAAKGFPRNLWHTRPLPLPHDWTLLQTPSFASASLQSAAKKTLSSTHLYSNTEGGEAVSIGWYHGRAQTNWSPASVWARRKRVMSQSLWLSMAVFVKLKYNMSISISERGSLWSNANQSVA